MSNLAKRRLNGGGSSTVAWLSCNGVSHINEVTVRRTQSALSWVTVCSYTATHANSASYPHRDGRNEYWPREAPVLCHWEDNHRSSVALAMHYRLRGTSIYGLHGLRKEDEHLTYTPVRGTYPLRLP